MSTLMGPLWCLKILLLISSGFTARLLIGSSVHWSCLSNLYSFLGHISDTFYHFKLLSVPFNHLRLFFFEAFLVISISLSFGHQNCFFFYFNDFCNYSMGFISGQHSTFHIVYSKIPFEIAFCLLDRKSVV